MEGSNMRNYTDAALLSSDVVWIEQTPSAEDAGSKAEFTIGELAKEFGVTLRTLRFYENKRLLSPRREGLARLYSKADRDRLALILKGKKLGFTLSEIRQMVAASEGRGDVHALKLSREKCLEQIDLLEQQKNDLQEALAELRRIYASLSTKLVEANAEQG
jgi:DNA-binding transcriptional MerR regulator